MPFTPALDPTAFADAVNDSANDPGASLPSGDSATSAQTLSGLARWIAESMSAAGGWAQPQDPSILLGNQTGGTVYPPGQSEPTRVLANFDLPPNPFNGANGEGLDPFTQGEIWIHVVQLAAQPVSFFASQQPASGPLNIPVDGQTDTLDQSGPLLIGTTPGTLPAGGAWIHAKLPLASGPLQVPLQIIATGLTGQTPLIVDSIAVFSGTLAGTGGTPSTAPPIRSLADVQTNRPDSVSLTKAINDASLFPLLNYPRTLASHCFAWAFNSDEDLALLYRVRRGPNANTAADNGVDFWFYTPTAATFSIALSVGNPSSSPGSVVQQNLTKPSPGASVTGSPGSEQLQVTGPGWFGCTVPGGWTANDSQDVVISSGSTASISNVIAVEEDFVPSEFLVSSGGRNDPPPQRLVLPQPNGLAPNAPIIGSYWEQQNPGLQGTWSDRRTMLQNAVYHSIYRAQWLIFDQLFASAVTVVAQNFGNVSDSGYGAVLADSATTGEGVSVSVTSGVATVTLGSGTWPSGSGVPAVAVGQIFVDDNGHVFPVASVPSSSTVTCATPNAVGQGIATGTNADWGIYQQAPTVARWKHVTKRGAQGAGVWVKIGAQGQGLNDLQSYCIAFGLFVDGVPASRTAPYVNAQIPTGATEVWLPIPTLNGQGAYAVEEGAVHDVQLVLGFVDLAGASLGWNPDGSPASGPGTLQVSGVVVQELPPPPYASGVSGAFLQQNPPVPANGEPGGLTSRGANIPASSSAGTTLSVLCHAGLTPSASPTTTNAPNGRVWHVRYWAQITLNSMKAFTHIHLVLTSPDGTSIDVTPDWSEVMSGVMFSVSDDVLGDLAPANPMSPAIASNPAAQPPGSAWGFAGRASYGVWTMKAYDSVDGSVQGTFDGFSLELT